MSKKYIVRKRRFINGSITASALMVFSKEVLEAYSKVNVFRMDKRKERRRWRKFKSKMPLKFRIQGKEA